MKLYDLPASPNARRVRIFLAEKGLDVPMVPVNMMTGENQTDDYLAKNSLGRMPLLELEDGSCIAESMAICRYLEEMHPSPSLMGNGALESATIEMWQRRMEFEFILPIISIFRHTADMWKDRFVQIPEVAEQERIAVKARMEWLDKELNGKQFIAGGDYSVADITAQCAFVMAKAALGIRIPEELKNLSGWWARVSTRPTARA
ncbi:MAG: glutathione S-transferase [SAR86 cluster bacterium]|uniref:glutathione transferase n=1 Tax=SAR86 cluster bacterium TaxID=2030880 RepID=A0A2A4XD93_9GAMM|nr:MAG: glutathione S-transferase [SAR86 cluster bacterium]